MVYMAKVQADSNELSQLVSRWGAVVEHEGFDGDYELVSILIDKNIDLILDNINTVVEYWQK